MQQRNLTQFHKATLENLRRQTSMLSTAGKPDPLQQIVAASWSHVFRLIQQGKNSEALIEFQQLLEEMKPVRGRPRKLEQAA
jgi:hypothetical protein